MHQFFEAIRNHDLATLESLWQADPTVLNAPDDRGFTPLILAVYNDQTDVVDFLLEKGVALDGQDASGNTALMGAVFKGHVEIARLLLDKGAFVDVKNDKGATALTYAASFAGHEVIELL